MQSMGIKVYLVTFILYVFLAVLNKLNVENIVEFAIIKYMKIKSSSP